MVPRKYTPEQEAEIVALYQEGKTTQELAILYGGSKDAIRNCARRHGVIAPNGRRPYRYFSDEEVAEMYGLWEAGESQTAIAKKFDTVQVVISRVLRLSGYELESRPSHLSGEQHGSWQGGRTYSSGGYILVKVSADDSMASMRGRQGYIMEHRLVMARSLGRPLTSTETVHHVNGEVTDNRLENLQLRQGKHGKGTIVVCGDCGSHNIVPMPIKN